jgi:hypothetical protein
MDKQSDCPIIRQTHKHTHTHSYCEQTLSEEQRLFKCIYSMMQIIQINFILYKMEAGKNKVGSKQKREGETDRDKQIKGVKEGENMKTARVEK